MDKEDILRLEGIISASEKEILDAVQSQAMRPNYQIPFYYSIPAQEMENTLKNTHKKIRRLRGKRPLFADYGCGDAVMLLLAHRAGYSSAGVEIEPALVEIGRRNIVRAHGSKFIDIKKNHITIYQADMFEENQDEHSSSLYEADVHYLSIFPSLQNRAAAMIASRARKGSILLVHTPAKSYSWALEKEGAPAKALWCKEYENCTLRCYRLG